MRAVPPVTGTKYFYDITFQFPDTFPTRQNIYAVLTTAELGSTPDGTGSDKVACLEAATIWNYTVSGVSLRCVRKDFYNHFVIIGKC